MKKIKWICVGIFLLSAVYFAVYTLEVLRTKDEEGPVIEMEQTEIHVSVKDGDAVLLQGITATDKKDGDVTDSLVVESMSGLINGNERYVNYAAFDSNNHVSKASRKLIYTDYEPARFYLSKPLRFAVNASGNIDILGNIRAVDCLDGDISDKIGFSEGSNIEVDTDGEYKVEIEVTNSAGDTHRFSATVTIYDPSEENAGPQIKLSEYLVYTKVGQSLNPRDYIQSVIWHTDQYTVTDGRGTFAVDTSGMTTEELSAFRQEEAAVSYDRFTILDETDYQTPGTYEVQYLLTDENGNTGKVNLIVVVEEA